MTDTAIVPRKNGGGPDGQAPLIDEQPADQLLGKAQAEGVELLGPDGLLSTGHADDTGLSLGRAGPISIDNRQILLL
jgi:hypothetical protein